MTGRISKMQCLKAGLSRRFFFAQLNLPDTSARVTARSRESGPLFGHPDAADLPHLLQLSEAKVCWGEGGGPLGVQAPKTCVEFKVGVSVCSVCR